MALEQASEKWGGFRQGQDYGNDMVVEDMGVCREAIPELFSLFMKHMDETARATGCIPKRLMIAWDTGHGYELRSSSEAP